MSGDSAAENNEVIAFSLWWGMIVLPDQITNWDSSTKREWFQQRYLKRTWARFCYSVANTIFQVIRVDYQLHFFFFFFCGIKAPNLSWSLSFFKPELSHNSCFVTAVLSWAGNYMYHTCISTSLGIKKCHFGAWLLEWNHIKLKVALCLSSVANKPCHHQNLLPGMWGWTLLWDSFLAQCVLWAV